MRINLKLLLISELVLLVTVLVLVVPVWAAMGWQVRSALQRELRAIATTAALDIDGDLHEQIRGPEDADTEAFRTLRDALARVQQVNGLEQEHVYTFYRDGDVVRFGVMLHPAPFVGDEYPLQPAMRNVFDRGDMVVTEIYEDEHGEWISAYAPIRDSADRIVGLLEVDRRSAAYFSAYRQVTLLTVALAGVALLVSSVFGWWS